jgi:hypothetical protein
MCSWLFNDQKVMVIKKRGWIFGGVKFWCINYFVTRVVGYMLAERSVSERT